MKVDDETEFTIMQYGKEVDLPIFIKFRPGDFDPELLNLLIRMKFSIVQKENNEQMKTLRNTHPMARVLKISRASTGVNRQINQALESDRWGDESIQLQNSFKLYRYKGLALMIYSLRFKDWEIGCKENFGSAANQVETQIVVNRFLSWSLASLGIIGFWGDFRQKQIVVSKNRLGSGDAFYIDVMKHKVYCRDGIFTTSHFDELIRVEKQLSQARRKTSVEEAIAILSLSVTWMDPEGLTVPVRQMIYKVAQFWPLFQVMENKQTEEQDNKSDLSPS